MISLLAAVAALPPKLVSLHDFAASSPKLVSLNDFALGCRCRFVSQACRLPWKKTDCAFERKRILAMVSNFVEVQLLFGAYAGKIFLLQAPAQNLGPLFGGDFSFCHYIHQ